MTTQTCDVAVVGGGLAGSAFATQLAKAGRDVLLLERSREAHHKVCGEFLSHEALFYLRQLDVDLTGLGAVSISRVRLYQRGLIAERALPFPAMSLTRMRLDEALLRGAQQAGARVLRGTQVNSIQPANGSWHVHTRDGEDGLARTIVMASGKHDIHGRPRPEGRHAGLVGCKMYYKLCPAQHAELADAVELALFPGGYAGLQPVEDGRVNLCLLMRADVLARVGSGWPKLQQYLMETSSVLARRLRDATPMLQAPLTVARIPYGFLRTEADDGMWHIGDQAAVIPSFSGDGMSIALHSAMLAARTCAEGGTADDFQQELARQLHRPMRLATFLSVQLVDRPWLASSLRLWPALLAHLGSMTRIPGASLLQPR